MGEQTSRRWTLEDLWCDGCGWQTVADGPDVDGRVEVVEAGAAARETADRVLSVLDGRKGFDWWWSGIDEECQAEIKAEIARCVDGA